MATTLDIIKLNNSEQIIGAVEECVKSIPELQFFEASPVIRNSYKTLAVESWPEVGFRAPNTMRQFGQPVLGTKQVDCRYLDASWTLDIATATQADWGKDYACAIVQMAHLKAALFKCAEQVWWGNYDGSSDYGFSGLNTFIDGVIEDGQKTNVITANESYSDGSTVFAVRTGVDSCQLAWGSEGKITEGEIYEQLITSTAGGTTSGAWHYAQQIAGWAGLQVTSRNAAAKIEGLSDVSGKTSLNDNLLAKLINKFPASQRPTAFFMSSRSLEQLRASRTATNATGAPAPFPSEAFGVPIYVSDAIGNSQTSASGSGSGSGSGGSGRT